MEEGKSAIISPANLGYLDRDTIASKIMFEVTSLTKGQGHIELTTQPGLQTNRYVNYLIGIKLD